MSIRQLHRHLAFAVVLIAFTATSTVTAWADDCPGQTAMECCDSPPVPSVQEQLPSASIAATMPECCQTIHNCSGVRYQSDDATTASTTDDIATATHPVRVATAAPAIIAAPRFVPTPKATAPPPRTIVLLL